jgi:four helix bundle protein
MTPRFDHEKLDVYQKAIEFCAWAGELLEKVTVRAAVRDQLDRASTSIPLNIAEGNGKFSARDRCRFLEIAYGSAVESAACLNVMVARKLATAQDVEPGRALLINIVSMLAGLISSVSARVREESEEYVVVPGGTGRE